MTASIRPSQIEEEFVAEITDLAYQALLHQGLRGSFLDTQLSLWAQIRAAFQRRAQSPHPALPPRRGRAGEGAAIE
jgi:hypothetical protein